MIRICTLLLMLLVTPVWAEKLVLTASEWPPYASAGLYRNGVAVALTEEALRRAGYETETMLGTWPEALDETIAGSRDVITSVWRTEEREQQLAFSEPFLTNYIVFIKRDDSDAWFNERADLDGLRIGVVADYAYSAQPYDTAGIDIQLADSALENIEKLRAGELDLVLADSRVAAYQIDKLVAAKELTLIRNPLLKRGLRIAVTKSRADHAEIITAFDASIQRMQTDGSYNAILATFRVSQ
jgi:polar amino acid transport system substrate-binding protein